MNQSGTPRIDPNDDRADHVIGRLETAGVGWLTTVAADGTPQTSPIWFLWDGEEILLYSLDSPRVQNLAENPRVSFNLDGNGRGGEIVVIEGTARIDGDAPSPAENLEYIAKYKPVMDEYGWTLEWFADRYAVPIRIAPTKYRYW